jgi:hypothetical protein
MTRIQKYFHLLMAWHNLPPHVGDKIGCLPIQEIDIEKLTKLTSHTHLPTNVQFFWSLNGLNSPTFIMFLPKNSLAQTTHDFAFV